MSEPRFWRVRINGECAKIGTGVRTIFVHAVSDKQAHVRCTSTGKAARISLTAFRLLMQGATPAAPDPDKLAGALTDRARVRPVPKAAWDMVKHARFTAS